MILILNWVLFLFQNTLNQLERDCDNIGSKVDEAIAEDNSARSHNMWAWSKALGYFLLGAFLPLMLLINLFASSLSDKFMKDLLGQDGLALLKLYLVSLENIQSPDLNFPLF